MILTSSALAWVTTTPFPGSLILPPPGANEERPWLGLVTCVPESGRLHYIVEGRGALVGILSILSLRECGICCHQNKPGTEVKFCQRRGKRIHHVMVEIQVAVGCGLVQLGTLHIVKICSWRQKNNCTPPPRQPRLCVWRIFELSLRRNESKPRLL